MSRQERGNERKLPPLRRKHESEQPWTRHVTAETSVPPADENADSRLWDSITGRGDPKQRFQLRRLCECDLCDGSGKVDGDRCPDCRGEGRTLELVATCATPEAVGVALIELGREGEWEECPVGILDTEGEPGQKWLVRPWLPSPRNVSDAGRTLRSARKERKG